MVQRDGGPPHGDDAAQRHSQRVQGSGVLVFDGEDVFVAQKIGSMRRRMERGAIVGRSAV